MPVSVFEVPRIAESVMMSGISGLQLHRLLLAMPAERNRDSAHQVLKEMIEAECARLTVLVCSVSARLEPAHYYHFDRKDFSLQVLLCADTLASPSCGRNYMSESHGEALTKISVRVYEPLFRSFQRFFKAPASSSVLKRDALLDYVIAGEIEHVRADLRGKKLSPKARQYVSAQIKESKTVQASFAVRKSTADALNSLVADHNLVRDALVGWIMAMLSAGPVLLKALDLPMSIDEDRETHWHFSPSTVPLTAIADSLADPFQFLRAACEVRHGVGLYALDMTEMPASLIVFSCFLRDENVPGTKAHKEQERESDWLSALLTEPDETDTTNADAEEKKYA